MKLKKFRGVKKLNAQQLKEKRELLRLRRISRKQANIIKGYKLYQKQQNAWKNSPMAKCLAHRKREFADNVIGFFGMTEQQRKEKHQKEMKEVWNTCSEVTNKALPFANGACFDKIGDILSSVFTDLSNFMTNGTPQSLKHLMDSAQKSFLILRKECINIHAKDMTKTCQDYFREELKDANITEKDIAKAGNNALTKLNIGFQWNKLKNVMSQLMDEHFWLNAPDDCGVKGQAGAIAMTKRVKNTWGHKP